MEIKNPKEKEDIENKVIDLINRGAGGRLIIFKPSGNKNADALAVKKRADYKSKEIFFKVYGCTEINKDGDYAAEVLQEELKPEKNTYLMFVYFDEVKQIISDNIWVLPSVEFSEIIDPQKPLNGKSFFKFETPLNAKSKNKYTKFLVSKSNLGKLLMEMLETKGEYIFKDEGFRAKQTINSEKLKDFIAEARKNTYASNAVPVDNPRLFGSVQLEFQRGDYFYEDIYFEGKKELTGQEIVYQNNLPVWSMVYSGSNLPKEIIGFLKQALSFLAGQCRFGKKCELQKREFKYQDRGQGALEKFSGEEEIFLKGKVVYKLNYHGGLIAK